MRSNQALLVSVLILLLLLSACADRSDPEKGWGGSTHGNGDIPGNESASILKIQGDHGDIEIRFVLAPADNGLRTVTFAYSGACAGSSWRQATLGGDLVRLTPGEHTATWFSFDDEAGCAGSVQLRLETNGGEQAESASFQLDNTQDGATGFFTAPSNDQGIQDDEADVFDRALDALLANDAVDFIATRRGDVYEVYSARGSVFFTREQDRDGYHYEIESVEGDNPIARQDPYWIPTLAEEQAAGSNPNGIDIKDQGYESDDPRLSFIEPEDDSYPFGYQRIAAYFDNPDSADFQINLKSYTHAVPDGDLGTHGSLNIVQSRCPLIFWGKGITPGVLTDEYRQVDIAPTVAKLLGMHRRLGVDERGIWSRNVRLGWQDGHVIEEVLNGETSPHVVILVLDGMASTEMYAQIQERFEELPTLARVFGEGAYAEFGSTTNWPSVTYPSHNAIGSSMYSGHHGVVDNAFYYRDELESHNVVHKALLTEEFFLPLGPGESLHQAIARVFGEFNRFTGKGAVTASLMDPSVAGATKADLEFRDQTRQSPFPPLGVEWPQEIPEPYLDAGNSNAYFEMWATWAAMIEIFHLYGNGVTPMPTYLIMNYIATDGSGHANGPHGDDMPRVLDYFEANLSLLLYWFDLWGIANDVTLIITSDHGMQLGDPSRSDNPLDSLEEVGVKIADDTYLGGYLLVPLAEFEPSSLTLNEDTMVSVQVYDEDNNLPLAGATIFADDGVTYCETVTDEFGYAQFAIAPVRDVFVRITHPEYSYKDYWLPVR